MVCNPVTPKVTHVPDFFALATCPFWTDRQGRFRRRRPGMLTKIGLTSIRLGTLAKPPIPPAAPRSESPRGIGPDC